MKRGLYLKLAFTNVRKNKNSFFPFLLSVVTMTAMFYMLEAIAAQAWEGFYGAEQIQIVLKFGMWIVGIVSAIIIFYTNSFLMKRRNQELGLYNVLGMEKKHIAKVLSGEMLIMAAAGMGIGLLAGIVFSKLLFLVLIRMIGMTPEFQFSIPLKAVLLTFVWFAAIFFVVFVWNLLKTARLKPVELMRETHAGEREPKAKWFLAFLGVAVLAAAYWMALTSGKAIDAWNTFFAAVLLVIIGTYLVFIAGSIVLLKLLKGNKSFYYHKTHFVTVSGMLYRMKQNATGLATICILVTMVIVTFSTTVSMYAGIEDEMRVRNPKDVAVTVRLSGEDSKKKETYIEDSKKRKSYIQRIEKKVKEYAKRKKVRIEDVRSYCESTAYMTKDGKASLTSSLENTAYNMVFLRIMVAEEYRELSGQAVKGAGTKPLLLTSKGCDVYGNILQVDGHKLSVEKAGRICESMESVLAEQIYLLVNDYEEMKRLTAELLPGQLSGVVQNYEFDLGGALENKKAFGKGIEKQLLAEGFERSKLDADDYYSNWEDAVGIYASVLFIGIFIGILFLVATILIIYYKQISEGYEDQKNFQIMSRIGLSNNEISHIINSQICTVFLLPIGVSVVHICFAYPLVKKIMAMMNLTNEKLFVSCTIGTVLVFIMIYLLIYKITSKVYYKIVRRAD